MPIPAPQSGESERSFIARCMSSEVMQREFPKQRVRLGVCYSQQRRGQKRKEH